MSMHTARHFKTDISEAEKKPHRTPSAPKLSSAGNTIWNSLATSIASHTESNSGTGVRRYNSTSSRQAPAFVQRITAGHESGEPVSESIRSQVEPVLGTNLKHVLVHNDLTSHHAATSLQAKAFTHRNHIFLGKGQSTTDKRLLAHELTHVAQQSITGSVSTTQVQCTFACPSNLENEIWTLQGRLEGLPPECSPERDDLEAQLAWRQQLAAQCGRLTGYTTTMADSLAYYKAEAMLHRGRIADASRELARMEPASSTYRTALDEERDRHREELIGILETRSTLLEREIASLRESLLSGPYFGEASPEQALLIQYEDEWVAHQNELRPLRRWQARRRINAIQAELHAIDSWLQVLPQVCSADAPESEELLNQRMTLLTEQRRLADFLSGSMVEYEQFDPRWGAIRYGTNPSCTSVREAGCGPTSLAIVLNYLYSEDPELAGTAGDMNFVSPPETVRYAETHGRVCNSGTAGDTMVTNVHTGWPGFHGRRISLDDATAYLRQGIPVIFLCRNCTGRTRSGGSSSYGGHFMVLRSVDISGTTYRVLDPGRGERRDIETISFNELQHHTAGFWVIERT